MPIPEPSFDPNRYAQVSHERGVLRVALEGPSIGQDEAPKISRVVLEQMDAFGAILRFLVLDFSRVGFINSMGLGMCIDLKKQADKLNAHTVLYGMNAHLDGMVKFVKVQSLFEIAPTEADLDKILQGK
jgi:anti-anti-sigma factor